jgi:hypothetical protein
MRLAIVGSRTFDDYELLCAEIYKNFDIYEIREIVSGGARGADKLGERFAAENGIFKRIFYPDWKKHGKAAGMIRNKDIIIHADVVIAFWDGFSRGAKDSMDYAEKTGKRLVVVKFKPKPKPVQEDPFADLWKF